MAGHFTFVCHAPTAATRNLLFPSAHDALDAKGTADAIATATHLRKADLGWTSPALAARQTADAFHPDATPDAALRECDYGRWTGRALSEIHAEDPEALAAWMRDPAAAPHGGETVVDLLRRVAAWMDAQTDRRGRVVVVTHASVMRAAIVYALRGTPESCLRIDVAPLSRTLLSFNGEWRLKAAGLT